MSSTQTKRAIKELPEDLINKELSAVEGVKPLLTRMLENLENITEKLV